MNEERLLDVQVVHEALSHAHEKLAEAAKWVSEAESRLIELEEDHATLAKMGAWKKSFLAKKAIFRTTEINLTAWRVVSDYLETRPVSGGEK